MPSGPRCTAEVGTTTTCSNVSSSMRTLTNCPGQSCKSLLGKSALRRMVPVVWSTWLSITSSWPVSSTFLLSVSSASTFRARLATARLMSGRSCCGRVKSTEIGCTSVMTTMPRVGGAHEIADVDHAHAGAPGDRGDDAGIAENGARVLDRRVVGFICASSCATSARWVSTVLAAMTLAERLRVALEVALGVGELRLVQGLLGDRPGRAAP